MKFRSTWILVIVLALIAAYFFLVEQRRQETKPPETGESRNVLPYGREDIERIVLINPAGERIIMERAGEEWTIVQPTRTRASKPTIDAFLLQVVPGLKLETFPDVQNLGDFGFDDPFATVIFSARGRTHPDTIHIGDKTPTSAKCYARLGSSRTVLVTRELTHNVMNKTLYHLRDKNLFNIVSDDIDHLTVLESAARIALTKQDRVWRFDGSRLRADNLTLEQYLNTLTSAIVHGFIREDPTGLARFGLKNPYRKLIIDAGGNTITVAFGRTEERLVYALRSGIDEVLRLPDNLLHIFTMDRDMLRAKEITFTEMDEVKGIRVEMGDTVIAVAERGALWHFTIPHSSPAGQHAVKHLLSTLRSIRFEELFDATLAPPEVRDDAASISITLEDASGGTIDLIMIATSTAGYEFGSSTSALVFGRLADGTVARIRRLIDRLRG